ncbi:competence type IV pilus ATPase ComGA [Sporosarcina pasteurii]|uniref:Type II traffic warden ATPase n=1 Tax=Sporosarcina pasteurii TaxID=1474 RepID=A0A380BNI3_SPOPA|nr:competence type IV pilus ATPase ComGA [Sporosarcina pasteurii]MDS9471074.1 competence type IV pilus ATPase ComGA [Sporosarcina pasteurii]QBQ05283.1 competence protein ComG [Sporosarcina pasteurii]SUJ04276.1 Type II traffic warden ATPase [Sporosarcina pasteurii]
MAKNENVIERKCNNLLEQAVYENATDIHLIPSSKGYDVNFNRGSKLTKIGSLPPQLAERMISFYKFLSSLDISDKRKPQSGSFHKKMHEENFSFRVSTIPAIHYQESVVIRVQKHNRIVPIDQLCLEKEWADTLRTATAMPQGLILLSGPTGSGKTTTMYSLTSHCANNLNRHVITLEDPVENKHAHLLQIQVNESAGMTYSTGLKAILRHSPDVIMLGEIRDAETAKIAVSAALTGHLVFSTVHSKDPVGTIYRMLDFGVSLEELRQTMICISTQRLIVKNNGEMGAVFEMIANEAIEAVLDSIKKGERFTYSTENKMTLLLQKYSQSQSKYEK